MDEPEFGVAWRLLGRLWFQEVDRDLLQALREPALATAFEAAGGSLPDHADGLDELAADYCQLFIGPAGHLPPIQSVWQAGTLQAQPSDSMRAYVQCVQGVAAWAREANLVDHLGVELEVAGAILQSASSFVSPEEHEMFYREYQSQHLRWPSTLLEEAREKSTTDFYRGIIAMTRNLLEL